MNSRAARIKRITFSIIPVFLFLSSLLSLPAYSRTIQIDNSLQSASVGLYLEFLRDDTGSLSIGDVQSKKHESGWTQSKDENPNFGFTDSVYWLRFTVKNVSRNRIDFYLEQAFSLIDHIGLYIPENGSFRTIVTGDAKPFHQRPLEHKNFVFPLSLDPGESAAYYLRYQSESTMNVVLTLWSPAIFSRESTQEYFLLLLFHGIILIMALYNLLLFIFIRRREYLYYMLFIMLFSLYMVTQNGLAFQFLWPEAPLAGNIVIPASLSLTILFAVLFSRNFTDLKDILPSQFRATTWMAYAAAASIPLSLILSFRHAVIASSAIALVLILYATVLSILLSLRRIRTAYFYLISWSAFLIGALLYGGKQFGILPNIFITRWSIHIGSIVMALLLSIALADRINTMRKDLTTLTENLGSVSHIISAMFNFANRINEMGNLDDILQCVVDTIIKFINCKRISIMLVDNDRQNLVIKKSIGLTAAVEKQTRLQIGSGQNIAGKVFDDGKILVINDLKKAGYEKAFSDYDAFVSIPFICSPLFGHSVKLGVINITEKEGNAPFTERDTDIISYISNTAAIAINNQINETKLEDSFLGTIKSLAGAIEAKDPYTRGHSDRVSKLAVGIALQMDMSREEVRVLKFAGILHDIGKIGISESVLGKPDKLTKEEFDLIKMHPEIGEHILKDITLLEGVRHIIRHHHERLDGSGYPDGLKGDQIPLYARIMAVADSFDAMNTDRPYRKRIPLDTILHELQEISGMKLDPACVTSLISYIREVERTGIIEAAGIKSG